MFLLLMGPDIVLIAMELFLRVDHNAATINDVKEEKIRVKQKNLLRSETTNGLKHTSIFGKSRSNLNPCCEQRITTLTPQVLSRFTQ
jgi:hypothetical protein